MTATAPSREPLISVQDLEVIFPTALGTVRPLNGVTFDIAPGKVLGVVGESGCGKSVTARSIMRIIEKPGRITGGQILFRPGAARRDEAVGAAAPTPGGETVGRAPGDRRTRLSDTASAGDAIDLATLDPEGSRMRSIRGAEIAMIFQEPMTSLNPVYTIGSQIEEAILLHRTSDRAEARKQAIEMLREVGMPSPERVSKSYPHQLSGGMRQRAMIAMALSCAPRLLVADEPTTALDVTTQAQILSMMRDLQDEFGASIMFITHSMGVVAQLCDDVVVMYLGRVVERAPVEDIFYETKHPYTALLLRAIPKLGGDRHAKLEVIKGSIPDPYSRLPGCPFHPRCPYAMPGLCDRVMPGEVTFGEGGQHTVRCHLYGGQDGTDEVVPADTSADRTIRVRPPATPAPAVGKGRRARRAAATAAEKARVSAGAGEAAEDTAAQRSGAVTFDESTPSDDSEPRGGGREA